MIKNQENEILRLREKLSVSRQDKGSDQVGIIQHNARNAGRKKNSESETHKVIFERFDYLMESQASMDEIIETMGISRATYYRYKKELVNNGRIVLCPLCILSFLLMRYIFPYVMMV